MVPPAKVLTRLCNELGESGSIFWQHRTSSAGKNVVSENSTGPGLAIDQAERLLESTEDATYTLCFVSESYPDFSHPQQQSFVLNRFYCLRQASTLGGERREINWLLHALLSPSKNKPSSRSSNILRSRRSQCNCQFERKRQHECAYARYRTTR
jgi:hypothetical protein